MSGEYPRGMLELYEDFLHDNGSLTEVVASSATQDVHEKHGGWWEQNLAGDGGDACLLGGERAFEVDEGHPLIFETRLYVSDVSVASVFVGMSDSNADSVVYEDEDGTLESVATDVFGFMLEGEQDETWQAVATDTDVDKTQDAMTLSADAADNVIQTLRLEANPNDSGTAKYFIDGELVKTKTSWFDSGIVFCPVLSSDDRDSAYNVYYDYLYCAAPRS
jgi:hypothetical protein